MCKRGFLIWDCSDPRKQVLINRLCVSGGELVQWMRKDICPARSVPADHFVRTCHSRFSGAAITYTEAASNAALVLLAVACSLLDKHIDALAKASKDDEMLANVCSVSAQSPFHL